MRKSTFFQFTALHISVTFSFLSILCAVGDLPFLFPFPSILFSFCCGRWGPCEGCPLSSSSSSSFSSSGKETGTASPAAWTRTAARRSPATKPAMPSSLKTRGSFVAAPKQVIPSKALCGNPAAVSVSVAYFRYPAGSARPEQHNSRLRILLQEDGVQRPLEGAPPLPGLLLAGGGRKPTGVGLQTGDGADPQGCHAQKEGGGSGACGADNRTTGEQHRNCLQEPVTDAYDYKVISKLLLRAVSVCSFSIATCYYCKVPTFLVFQVVATFLLFFAK